MEFISLLYYLGNLTIEGEDVGGWLVFRIPNKVIAELYWEYYAYLLEQEAQWEDAVNTVPMAIRQMALSGNAQAFFEELEALLQRLSNRDFRRMGEKHVKMVMMALLMQGGIFDIYSERELEGGGYVDMELYVRANSLKEHHQFALEVKYLRKEQEGFLAEVMERAKGQILGYYRQDSFLQNKRLLHLLVVVVVNDKVYWEEVFY
ncbi:MAG: PD-(D/E)XK nuclease domain-containing protein, partial [Bacteroidia bacterium]|nr:PD-(D/E)XK nuclease domain-containing protein [Bacteroidia bacterium]